MDELNSGQNPVILPPLVVEKPTSITVFGILDIVFGGVGILINFMAIMISSAYVQLVMNDKMKIWLLISLTVKFGLFIYLIILGVGLLMMKKWSRIGSILYGCFAIIWGIAVIGVNLLAFWVMHQAEGQRAAMIGGMVGVICVGIIGLIYPVLLLIFMQTEKVKSYFAAAGE